MCGTKMFIVPLLTVNAMNTFVDEKSEGARNVIVCRDAKSPFWMAQFTGPNGRRCRRSTKVPVNGGVFEGERLTAAQAKRRALLVAFRLAEREVQVWKEEDNRSVRELFDLMLRGKLGRVSAATYENARADYGQFCRWLGRRADEPARLITRADVKEWVVCRRAEVRCKTVQKGLTALKAAFAWAVDAEVLPKNPCVGVRVPPDGKDERVVHEAFSPEEVQVLLERLPDEWAAAVRCCLGTYGQRLGDVLALRWEQFDWDERVVRLVTGKTGRVLRQPMQPGFFAWARERFEVAQGAGGDAAVWVLPRLRLHSNPSAEFTQLVRLFGIGLVGREAGGRRRTWHSKTFHCLRATVATQLQAAGVPQGLAMELVGHDAAAVHAVYIRPSVVLLRQTVERLPEF